jgi:hypothetical protein
VLPPAFFTDARMAARHFVQARILRFISKSTLSVPQPLTGTWRAQLDVQVTRVFRGDLPRGARLTFWVAIYGDGPMSTGSMTLYRDEARVLAARHVEAFLDGDPPVVVCDQMKFLRQASWHPSADPAKVGYGW